MVLRQYLLERMSRSGEAGEAAAHGATTEDVPTPRKREQKRGAKRREEGEEQPAAKAGRPRTKRAS